MPDMGKIAYDAYWESMATAGYRWWKPWEDLTNHEREAWREAAQAVAAGC